MNQYLYAKQVSELVYRFVILIGGIAVDAASASPWSSVGPLLSKARRLLDEIDCHYNDFERAVEQRYATEIAAAEEP